MSSILRKQSNNSKNSETQENNKKQISPEIRVKFTTDQPELKMKENLQSMIIKTQFTRKEIINLIKKLCRYQGDREIDLFIENNKLFGQQNISLSTFLMQEDVETDEKLINIFYSFQMEEPQLLDSKKQDEWIKKLKKIPMFGEGLEDSLFSVGLFNSEINFYDTNTHNKIKLIKHQNQFSVIDEEFDQTDYLYLNDYIFLTSDNNKQRLMVKAIRDNEFSLEISELYFSLNENKKQRKESTNSKNSNKNKTFSEINMFPSQLSGRQDHEYVCMENNNFLQKENFSVFTAGEKNGNLHLYKIKDYQFANEDLLNNDNSNGNKNQKRKINQLNSNKRQIILPEKEMKISDHEIFCQSWISKDLISTGDIDHIKLINVENLSIIHQFNVNHHLVTSLDSIQDKILLSSHDNGSFKVWDINMKNSLVHNVNRTHKGFVSKVMKLNTEGSRILTCGYDGDVKVWDIRKLDGAYFDFPRNNILADNIDEINKHKLQYSEKVFGMEIMNDYKKVVSGGSASYVDFYKVDM
jgi:WD40 repeat protein